MSFFVYLVFGAYLLAAGFVACMVLCAFFETPRKRPPIHPEKMDSYRDEWQNGWEP